MEDYKKKYEQALERARIWKEKSGMPVGRQGILDGIFPELKVSEDEKIRKELISHLNETIENIRGEEIVHHDAKVLVAKMQTWIAWLKKQNKQEQLYIRFGEIPADEKSEIYQGEIKVGTENGVSVYPAFKTDEGDIILGLSLPITKTTLYTQQHLIEYDNRPCYLVKGDYVGKDTDGQPLINNVSIIEKIDSYRIKEEKQGEQNPSYKIHLGKEYKCIASPRYSTFMIGEIYKPEDEFLCNLMNLCHECFEPIEDSEHKPTDKIELKFKVGDWAVWDNKISCHVDNIYQGKESLMYTITDINNMIRSYSTKSFDSNAHLWTIQDAKHGDVLVNGTIVLIVDHLGTFENNPIIYSWYFADSKKFYGMGTSKPDRWDVKGFTPATNEQRDTLFAKMKEAGYEWDAEKKELKKIEQNHVWSEEEKARIDRIVDVLDWAEDKGRISYSDWGGLC